MAATMVHVFPNRRPMRRSVLLRPIDAANLSTPWPHPAAATAAAEHEKPSPLQAVGSWPGSAGRVNAIRDQMSRAKAAQQEIDCLAYLGVLQHQLLTTPSEAPAAAASRSAARQGRESAPDGSARRRLLQEAETLRSEARDRLLRSAALEGSAARAMLQLRRERGARLREQERSAAVQRGERAAIVRAAESAPAGALEPMCSESHLRARSPATVAAADGVASSASTGGGAGEAAGEAAAGVPGTATGKPTGPKLSSLPRRRNAALQYATASGSAGAAADAAGDEAAGATSRGSVDDVPVANAAAGAAAGADVAAGAVGNEAGAVDTTTSVMEAAAGAAPAARAAEGGAGGVDGGGMDGTLVLSASQLTLGGQIAEGEFASVYRGLLWGQKVAVKRLKPRDVPRAEVARPPARPPARPSPRPPSSSRPSLSAPHSHSRART